MKKINFLKVLTFVMSVLPTVINVIEQARDHFKDDDPEPETSTARTFNARSNSVTPQSTARKV